MSEKPFQPFQATLYRRIFEDSYEGEIFIITRDLDLSRPKSTTYSLRACNGVTGNWMNRSTLTAIREELASPDSWVSFVGEAREIYLSGEVEEFIEKVPMRSDHLDKMAYARVYSRVNLREVLDHYTLMSNPTGRDFILLGVNGTQGFWDTGTVVEMDREVHMDGWFPGAFVPIVEISKGWTLTAPFEVQKTDWVSPMGRVQNAFKEFKEGHLSLNTLLGNIEAIIEEIQ